MVGKDTWAEEAAVAKSFGVRVLSFDVVVVVTVDTVK